MHLKSPLVFSGEQSLAVASVCACFLYFPRVNNAKNMIAFECVCHDRYSIIP